MKKIALILVSLLVGFSVVISGCTNDTADESYQLSVTITPNGGGTVSPGSNTYEQGKEVTLVATPAKHYKFNGWAGDISNNTDRVTVKMDSDKNVVASFAKITYSLQTNVDNPGSGTIDPASTDFEAGNQVRVTATSAKGFRFDHWGGSATGNANPIDVAMDSNKDVTAYFVKQYSLNITRLPNEAGIIVPNTDVYDANTKVEISASQAFPYAFNNWTGTDDDNVNPTTITMDSNKSITCNFITLSPGEWIEDMDLNYIYSGNSVSIPIELNRYEYAEGEIMGGIFHAYILDPAGNIIEDLGTIQTSNFIINAQIPGKYNIVLQNTSTTQKTSYTIKYRFYRV